MTEATTDDSWFYTRGGQRLGPVTADKLRELLAARSIDGETPIWRKGLADWQPLRMTEFGVELQDSPPPVGASHVNNIAVWMLAFAPIAFVFIDAIVYGYRVNHPEADQTFLNSLTWMIPFAINGGLGFGDERQLALAGHNTRYLKILAFCLTPVYLFVRAKRVKQTPTYGYTWIGSFILAAILASF